MDSATIDRIFDELKEGLLPLLDKINAAPRPDLSALEGHFDADAQKKGAGNAFKIYRLFL